MSSGRSREFPSHKSEPARFAAKATDLDALRTAVVDAAGVGYGLWFSYLFALLYFAIAAGAVTHRDLLLESPVKLPFLNVELPLKAFFILGPLIFLVVHAYVLLHFLLLAGKVGAFHTELQKQIPEDDEKRTQLRRQLPSNIFVQFLAGPREVRTGIVGFLLKSVAAVSLVAGPIALLVLFQLQFLPYHNPWITWWQRIAVLLDLILLWLLWPPIARGETTLLTWNDLRGVNVAAWLSASLLPLLMVFTLATFPGEWLDDELYRPASADEFIRGTHWWSWPHKLLVAGNVDYVTRKPESLWSNRLVLPNFELGDRLKFDPEAKFSLSPETVSLRGRKLEGVVFVGAHLRKADFTGAELPRSDFTDADLREAKFECGLIGNERKCAQLQGASLALAQLQGASLEKAQAQGASLIWAKLQGADLLRAQLRGASLIGAQLQGALLVAAQLQGAWLSSVQLASASLYGAQLQGAAFLRAQLQGASLDGAKLRGAYLGNVFVWRTKPPAISEAEGAWIVDFEAKPKYLGLGCASDRACDWKDEAIPRLKQPSRAGRRVPDGILR
jgi:uncharacterized protein YjbI with pentapeptide repeats